MNPIRKILHWWRWYRFRRMLRAIPFEDRMQQPSPLFLEGNVKRDLQRKILETHR